jgi:hypothetical protein
VTAVDSAVNLTVVTPAAGFVIVAGENVTPTPFGIPVALKVSGPVNAPVVDVFKVMVALLPRVTVKADAELDTENVPTLSVTVMGAGVLPPPVPDTVNLWVPTETELSAMTVSVVNPPFPLMLVAASRTEIPAGSEPHDSATRLVNP